MNWYNRQLVTAAIDGLRSFVDQVGQLGKQIIDTLRQSRQDPVVGPSWRNPSVAQLLNALAAYAKDAIRWLQMRKVPVAAKSCEKAFAALRKLCRGTCTGILQTVYESFKNAYQIVEQMANRMVAQPTPQV